MNRIVVDASVLIKLHIQEEGSSQAVAAVAHAQELFGPELIWAEVGNVLWKYVRRGELASDEARRMLDDMMRMPIQVIPIGQLIEQALQIAMRTDRSIYDSLYIATAVNTRAVVVTADQRLVHALSRHELAPFVRGLANEADTAE